MALDQRQNFEFWKQLQTLGIYSIPSKNIAYSCIPATLCKKSLKTSGFNLNSGINIVLNGETSNFLNIQLYCESFFGLNVTTKDLPEIDKNFAACLGCAKIIKDGWETEAIPVIKEKNLEKMGFFKRIFTNFW